MYIWTRVGSDVSFVRMRWYTSIVRTCQEPTGTSNRSSHAPAAAALTHTLYAWLPLQSTLRQLACKDSDSKRAQIEISGLEAFKCCL